MRADIQRDLGVFSLISADSQAMGRIGEGTIRKSQTASKMRQQRGRLPEDQSQNDNIRARQHIAKYIIYSTMEHRVSAHIGSNTPGKRADLVQWSPPFFAVKPEMVLVGGQVSAAHVRT